MRIDVRQLFFLAFAFLSSSSSGFLHHRNHGGARIFRPIPSAPLYAEKKKDGGGDISPFGDFGIPNPFEAVGKLFKKEEEPKSELDQFIDESVKGMGPMGGLLGAGLKSVAKGVGTMMEEQKKDSDAVTDETERFLRMDRAASDALGQDIRLGMPFSQMSNQVNGAKNIEMQMPATGTLGQGVVAVSAVAKEGEDLELTRLRLQTPSGGVLEIDVGADVVADDGRSTVVGGGSSSSGGSSIGGGSSGGGSGSASGDGDVVDVEIL
jgi:hypothetical protein